MRLSEEDLAQIRARGSDPDEVMRQLEIFDRGVPPANLDRPCTAEDGITRIARIGEDALLHRFAQARNEGRLTKMVPASGAASRMFKALHAAKEGLSRGEPIRDESVQTFLDEIDRFAFRDALAEALGRETGASLKGTDPARLLGALLDADGLDFGNKPKGLLPFHRYPDGARTPLEEHLHEAITLVRDTEGKARLHFTVSPEHRTDFEALLERARARFTGTDLAVSFSVQAPATDTIAVNPDNSPFREDGALVFRPGGHGALIHNLNQLDADLVMIKNIDNVVPDRLVAINNHHKMLLVGKLLEVQETLFDHINRLETDPSPAALAEAEQFLRETLGTQPATDLASGPANRAREQIMALLNRPLRVCGMVENVGEPGGGPFWVRGADGKVSTQIVESSQIDPSQMEIMKKATHFNPVDLVCGLRDAKGKRFDLTRFVDPAACFISDKSKDGKPLRALELPGLWNGAMADWNTVFVEVPLLTFNPVKTVNDLLRDTHLG